MSANRLLISGQPEDFVWASGVEDTFVPQARKGQRPLDEYELMGHYTHWREDLALAKELELKAIRWGVPWYRVEPQQGAFDWSWTDQVIPYLVEELGITPIVDLMHYGCPFWLEKEFVNKDYPRLVANYSRMFAERYQSLIQYYTPLNEPVVNALWCGRRGLWPPYLRGDTGYIKVMLQLAKGIQETVRAIQEVDSEARMVHVEATGLSRASTEELEVLALEDQHRTYLCLDLITGRVTKDHLLLSWLIRNGTSLEDLRQLSNNKISIDVLGLNFYPQWSTQQLFLDHNGKLAYRAHEKEGQGFGSLIHDMYSRYNAPIIITETSAFGSDELRARWLDTSLSSVKQLRAQSVPVIGYTWFPMFTMIDWRYRFGKGSLEQYRMELGMFKLRDNNFDSIAKEDRWLRTPLVEQFLSHRHNAAHSIGTFKGELRAQPPIHLAETGT